RLAHRARRVRASRRRHRPVRGGRYEVAAGGRRSPPRSRIRRRVGGLGAGDAVRGAHASVGAVSDQLFPGGSAFLVPFAVVATVVFAIVAVVTARRDPDPAGTRPYAVYLSLVLFVAVFTALFAATALISNVVRIPLKDYGSVGWTSYSPSPAHLRAFASSSESRLNDQHVAGAVESVLVV